ncbi:MAG: hypothetical protein ACXAD7_24700 [Candidatus Kariarchaeaceae archaeon]
MRKIYLLLLSLSLLISTNGQETFSLQLTNFSYSDDLKAGDEFSWTVTGNQTFVDTYLPSDGPISLKVKKDLADVNYAGNIWMATTRALILVECFEVDLGESIDPSIIIPNLLVFPVNTVLDNGTEINPTREYWVYRVLTLFDFPEEEIEGSVSISESGDDVTFTAEVTVSEDLVETTYSSNATINQKTGIMDEFEFEVEVLQSVDPTHQRQKMHITLTASSFDTESSLDETKGNDTPFNSFWPVSLLIVPIIRRSKWSRCSI